MQFDGLFPACGCQAWQRRDFIPGITADQPYLGVSKDREAEAYYIGKFKIDLESRFFCLKW